MKLELNHLAPYLPYGLKVQHLTFECGSIITEIESLSKECASFRDASDYFFDSNYEDNPIIKPLLLPLSALYEEIDGEIGIVELAKIEHPCSTYHILRNRAVEVAGDNKDSMSFKYDLDDNYFINSNFDCDDEYYPIMYQLALFDYLFLHHYDVYSLIDKGLAIDKRSVK